MYSEFWLKKSKEKKYEELVLFVESESESSCPNNCWCVRDICIDDPVVLGKGSNGITYASSTNGVILKMIVTNTKFQVETAEKETKIQIEAGKALPTVVAQIYHGKFCHPECLEPYQGIYRITMERLGMSFTDLMKKTLNNFNNVNNVNNENNLKYIFLEMRKAAEKFTVLNRAGYWHGDAHGGNILQTLDTNPSYKIIDFGHAQKIEPQNIPFMQNVDAFFFIIRSIVDMNVHYKVNLRLYPKLVSTAATLIADFMPTTRAKDMYNAWDDRVSSMFLPEYDKFYRELLNEKISLLLEHKKKTFAVKKNEIH